MLNRLRVAALWAAVCAPALAQFTAFSINTPQTSGCGRVEINGVVIPSGSAPVTSLAWDWGDGVKTSSLFPASHRYAANGSYTVTVTANTATGPLGSKTVNVTITNAANDGCEGLLSVQPFKVVLRAGKTREQLRVYRIPTGGGKALEVRAADLTFRSLQPATATVSPDGVITAGDLGDTNVEVTYSLTRVAVRVPVYSGQLRLEPPYLRLHHTANPSGALRLIAEKADGTSLPLTNASARFTLSGMDAADPPVAVSAGGVVTQLRPARPTGEVGNITARLTAQGVSPDNGVVVRVVDAFPEISFADYAAGRIGYRIARKVGAWDNEDAFRTHEVPRWTAIAREFEEEASGAATSRGGIHYLVNDVGGGPGSVPTIPCGLSGNPTTLGTDPNKPQHNSCLVVAYPPAVPQWFIIFHELGHDHTLLSRRFVSFMAADSGHQGMYMEGLASAMSFYAAERIREYAPLLGATKLVASGFGGGGTAIDDNRWKTGLAAYEAAGAPYASANADHLNGILAALWKELGTPWYFRFCSVFLPLDSGFDFEISGPAQQATFFVAALGAAARKDLRDRFRRWNFPIDEAYYARILPPLQQLADLREYPTRLSAEVAALLSSARPVIADRGVVNGASFLPGFASGTWVAIQGANLSSTTRIWQPQDFRGGRLPTELDGVQVSVNGKPAYIYYVSPAQINALMPADDALGDTTVVVTTPAGQSDPYTARKNAVSPALFMFDPEGRKYVAAVHADGGFLAKPGLFPGATTRPAKPGDLILLFATGLGQTNPATDWGAGDAPPAELAGPVRVTIGGVSAQVLYSGVVGPGLCQLNVVVPQPLPSGDQAIVVEIGGSQSQPVAYITIL